MAPMTERSARDAPAADVQSEPRMELKQTIVTPKAQEGKNAPGPGGKTKPTPKLRRAISLQEGPEATAKAREEAGAPEAKGEVGWLRKI